MNSDNRSLGLTWRLVQIQSLKMAATVQHLFGDMFDVFMRKTMHRHHQVTSVCQNWEPHRSLWVLLLTCFHLGFTHVPQCVCACGGVFVCVGRPDLCETELEAVLLKKQQIWRQGDDWRLIYEKQQKSFFTFCHIIINFRVFHLMFYVSLM